ncbi:pilus assembly protein PilP [Stigmatella sp. ncwal1]|uniref:Pilus assembly protein PilP n=1 Tax=Stigmatella ashevillensis TaxID=2995309 RepID=A0ABT5D884_9BACT|nr:pilus assembly protein PilP [Stigmatella ashevillena]MDC0709776.1 pilus assembly protein PilP [Stigmatella ashevillena]
MKTLKFKMTTAALALTVVACGGGSASPKASPPAAKKAATAAAAETPKEAVIESSVTYTYNPVGKRDPFRSPLEELDRTQQNVQVTACNEPLCAWDLDQLKLVAVVTGDANPIAMVEDPAGRGHIVRRNARMGRQGGRVTQILRDSVTVTEYIPTEGKVIPNPVSLQLKQDSKRDPAYDLMQGRNWGE